MDLKKMIAELQAERDRIDYAIEALERLGRKPPARRGRPPGWSKKQTEENHPVKHPVPQPLGES